MAKPQSIKMFRLVLLTALVAFAAGASPRVRPIVPQLDGRIVGGENADISDLPHQLSLQSRGSHICGASVLSATRALTAAHCTDGSSASSLSIRAGSTYRGSGGQVVSVSSIAQHPSYSARTTDYDVSVLKLASALTLGSNVSPISLHAVGAELATGTLATVSGWGTLSSGGSLPSILQRVDVPKVSDATCKSAYGSSSITARMTCHGFTAGGKDSCQGDSGGPLVVGSVQVGIVSWGAGCAAANYPGVYAKVANSEVQSYIRNNL